MTANSTSNNTNETYSKYRDDFLARVCDASEQNNTKAKEGIDYFLQRLHTLEEKAQADGLSDELLYEILSYDPASELTEEDTQN